MAKVEPNIADFLSDDEIASAAESLASNPKVLFDKAEIIQLMKVVEISDSEQISNFLNWAQETVVRHSLLGQLLDGTLKVKIEGDDLVFSDEQRIN